MSAGPRIALAQARQAAEYLCGCWGLDRSLETGDAVIVGSVRRQRPTVGDLEIVCPWAPAAGDQLFDLLHACSAGPGGLFERPADLPPITPERGLRAGFLEASVVASVNATRADGAVDRLALAVQVCRYKPGQRAWRIVMRTGPSGFGKWFLGRWKRAHNIPAGQPASIDGFLVDARGRTVACDDEAELFERCRVAYLPPEKRDAFTEDLESKGAWHG